MNEIMIDLQGGAKAPLYEKIYEYIKNEIVDGKISRGEKFIWLSIPFPLTGIALRAFASRRHPGL